MHPSDRWDHSSRRHSALSLSAGPYGESQRRRYGDASYMADADDPVPRYHPTDDAEPAAVAAESESAQVPTADDDAFEFGDSQFSMMTTAADTVDDSASTQPQQAPTALMAVAAYRHRQAELCMDVQRSVQEEVGEHRALRATASKIARDADFVHVAKLTIAQEAAKESSVRQFAMTYLTAWMLLRQSNSTRIYWSETDQMLLLSLDVTYSLSDLTEDFCCRKLFWHAHQPMENVWLRLLCKQSAMTMCGAYQSYEEYLARESRIRRQILTSGAAKPRALVSIRRTGKSAAQAAAAALAVPAYLEWSRTFRDEVVLAICAVPPAVDDDVPPVEKTFYLAKPSVNQLLVVDALRAPPAPATDIATLDFQNRVQNLPPLQLQTFYDANVAMLHPAVFDPHDPTQLQLRAQRTDEQMAPMGAAIIQTLSAQANVGAADAVQPRLATMVLPSPWEVSYAVGSVPFVSAPKAKRAAKKAKDDNGDNADAEDEGSGGDGAASSGTVSRTDFTNEQWAQAHQTLNAIQHAHGFDPAKQISLGGLVMRFTFDWVHNMLAAPRTRVMVEASEKLEELKAALSEVDIAGGADGESDDTAEDAAARKLRHKQLTKGSAYTHGKFVSAAMGVYAPTLSVDKAKPNANKRHAPGDGGSVAASQSDELHVFSSQWQQLVERTEFSQSQVSVLRDMQQQGVFKGHRNVSAVVSNALGADAASDVGALDGDDEAFFDNVTHRIQVGVESVKTAQRARQRMGDDDVEEVPKEPMHQDQLMVRRMYSKRARELMTRLSSSTGAHGADDDPNDAADGAGGGGGQGGGLTMEQALRARRVDKLLPAEHAKIVRFFNNPDEYHGKRPTRITELMQKCFPEMGAMMLTRTDDTLRGADDLLPSIFAIYDAIGAEDAASAEACIAEFEQQQQRHASNDALQRIVLTIQAMMQDGAVRSPELVLGAEAVRLRDPEQVLSAVQTAAVACRFAQQHAASQSPMQDAIRTTRLDFVNRMETHVVHRTMVKNVYAKTGLDLRPLFDADLGYSDATRDMFLGQFAEVGLNRPSAAHEDADNISELWQLFKSQYGRQVVEHLLRKATRDFNPGETQNMARAVLGKDAEDYDPLLHTDLTSALEAGDEGGGAEGGGARQEAPIRLPDLVHVDHYPDLERMLRRLMRADVRTHNLDLLKKRTVQAVAEATSPSPSPAVPPPPLHTRSVAMDAVMETPGVPPRSTTVAGFGAAPTPITFSDAALQSNGLAASVSTAFAPAAQLLGLSNPQAQSQEVFERDPPDVPQFGPRLTVLPPTDQDPAIAASQSQHPASQFTQPPPPSPFPFVQSSVDRGTDALPGGTIRSAPVPVAAVTEEEARVRDLIDFIDSQAPDKDKHGKKTLELTLDDGQSATYVLKPKKNAPPPAAVAADSQMNGDSAAASEAPADTAEAEARAASLAEKGRRVKSSQIGPLLFQALLITSKMVHRMAAPEQRSQLLSHDRLFRLPVTDVNLRAFFTHYWPTFLEQFWVQVQYARYAEEEMPSGSAAATKASKKKKGTGTGTGAAKKAGAGAAQSKAAVPVGARAHEQWELIVTPSKKRKQSAASQHQASVSMKQVASHLQQRNGLASPNMSDDEEMRFSDSDS